MKPFGYSEDGPPPPVLRTWPRVYAFVLVFNLLFVALMWYLSLRYV